MPSAVRVNATDGSKCSAHGNFLADSYYFDNRFGNFDRIQHLSGIRITNIDSARIQDDELIPIPTP